MDRDFTKTVIIAEAGVNHNGSLELAKLLVNAALESGADAVKFQTFKAEEVVSTKAPKTIYQLETTPAGETQLEMLKKLELSQQAHVELANYCKELGICFLSTPFDNESLRFLVEELQLTTIKISSGEITNAPFLLKIAQTGKQVILSTGMSFLGEVETALGVLAFGYLGIEKTPSLELFKEAYCTSEGQALLKQKVSLLHCTSEYPAPFADVNLRAIDTLKKAFGLPVGYSDHTSGIAVPIAAVARGACLIEKHFTLDCNLPGPDHRASLEPDELKEMITAIRQVEAALGSPVKAPAPSELKNISIARKSIVAAKPIKAGDLLIKETLAVKRPGDGISPANFWAINIEKATKDFSINEAIVLHASDDKTNSAY